MRRLVESAELSRSDLVIEVGAGTGGLTDLLCGRTGRVLCVEIDRGLGRILTERFSGAENVTVVCCDALASKTRVTDAIAQAITSFDACGGGAVKLVANLPYQIATPLILNLVVSFPAVRRLCFTVQAEAGARLTAPSGCRDYGPLAIMTQLLCTVKTTARLGPGAFWPRPAVDSVMMRLDAGRGRFPCSADAERCCRLVRRVFEHRRKTLRAALGYVVSDAVRNVLGTEFDLSQRPEQMPPVDWLRMSRLVGDF